MTNFYTTNDSKNYHDLFFAKHHDHRVMTMMLLVQRGARQASLDGQGLHISCRMGSWRHSRTGMLVWAEESDANAAVLVVVDG
jgi:hypothetical protein